MGECPTGQVNPYPYAREKIEISGSKFNRLEKLLVPGHLATWTLSHLSQLSRSVSTEKYFGPNLLVCSGLAEIRKILLERRVFACDSSAVNQTPLRSTPSAMKNKKTRLPSIANVRAYAKAAAIEGGAE